jgi:hypothetical protein
MPSPKLRARQRLDVLGMAQTFELILGPTVGQSLRGESAFQSPRIRLAAWREHRADIIREQGRDLWAVRELDGLRLEDLPLKGTVVELPRRVRRDADPVGEPEDVAPEPPVRRPRQNAEIALAEPFAPLAIVDPSPPRPRYRPVEDASHRRCMVCRKLRRLGDLLIIEIGPQDVRHLCRENPDCRDGLLALGLNYTYSRGAPPA